MGDGRQIPLVGLGTYLSDSGDETAEPTARRSARLQEVAKKGGKGTHEKAAMKGGKVTEEKSATKCGKGTQKEKNKAKKGGSIQKEKKATKGAPNATHASSFASATCADHR